MGTYRVYCLDRTGHIVQQAAFDAVDDAEAIARLERYSDSTDRELWQERRKVIVLPARAGPVDVEPPGIAT